MKTASVYQNCHECLLISHYRGVTIILVLSSRIFATTSDSNISIYRPSNIITRCFWTSGDSHTTTSSQFRPCLVSTGASKIYVTSNIQTYVWSIKYRLITKLITQLAINLRDESFKPNQSMIGQRGATVTCANAGLIRLKRSSRKLASIYVIDFIINLYLMLFISI